MLLQLLLLPVVVATAAVDVVNVVAAFLAIAVLVFAALVAVPALFLLAAVISRDVIAVTVDVAIHYASLPRSSFQNSD